MDQHLVRSNEALTYDPQISAYNTNFWKTLSGSDPTVPSTKLRITNAEIASYGSWRFSAIEFVLNVPTAPTAGNNRQWGFKCPALGNRGRVEFSIVDDVFAVFAYNDAGTQVFTLAITWDAAWTATDVRYGIRIGKDGIRFLIDGVVKAKTQISGHNPNPAVSSLPLPIHIKNGTASNLDMTAMIIDDVASLT